MRDDLSLEAAYRMHGSAVFRRARQLLGHDADAYEVVQDVFLSLFEKPDQFQGKSGIMTFLYSATTHACLNRIRNQKNRERLQSEQISAESLAPRPRLSPEQTAILHRVIQALPDDVCQAAVYSAVDGMTHQEIAELMNCSRRHVGDLLSRAASWAAGNEVPPC